MNEQIEKILHTKAVDIWLFQFCIYGIANMTEKEEWEEYNANCKVCQRLTYKEYQLLRPWVIEGGKKYNE